MIGARQHSPVELLESCIARIEKLDPALNAVVIRCFDRARMDAEAAEAAVMWGEPLGKLHGRPGRLVMVVGAESSLVGVWFGCLEEGLEAEFGWNGVLAIEDQTGHGRANLRGDAEADLEAAIGNEVPLLSG